MKKILVVLALLGAFAVDGWLHNAGTVTCWTYCCAYDYNQQCISWCTVCN